MKTLYSCALNPRQITVAAAALFVLTTPSLAIESTFVQSLRADNGDFEPAGMFKSQQSLASGEAVYDFQTGSIGISGGASNSKCIWASPREYDPLGPDCRN
jgi:hypothetical protein